VSDEQLQPKFGTIDTWCQISGISRRITYDLLGEGHLRAIKIGGRTLVDLEHGIAYLRSLPTASFVPDRRTGPHKAKAA
jgi:hypothetical protein